MHRFVYGNRDLTRVISEELGYVGPLPPSPLSLKSHVAQYVDLGPGPNKHTWGAALLSKVGDPCLDTNSYISKFPILNSTHHLLPSPHGELAPAIHATLDIHGEKVNVWVSHNGQGESAILPQFSLAESRSEQRKIPWTENYKPLRSLVTLEKPRTYPPFSSATLSHILEI